MATTVINRDYQQNKDNDNNNNDNSSNNEKTMLEGMLEFEARYPKLFEALAKDDKSLIRK